MKQYLTSFLLAFTLILSSCAGSGDMSIKFATSADYPPFEYYENTELTGFDVDLANLIAKHLGKVAIFENMQFSSIFAAIESGQVDAGISTIVPTKEREQNFDFSQSYHRGSLAAVFSQENPVKDKSELIGKRMACQIGTAVEIWIRTNFPGVDLITMDTCNQAIETLKAKNVDVVLMDCHQSVMFSSKNTGLSFAMLGQPDAGYSVAFKKGSELRERINQILEEIEKNGELQALKEKWIKN